MHSLPPPASSAHAAIPAQHTLLQRFLHVRAQTEQLAAPLSAEDCSLQSMADASPVKWHLAHTSWFFETFLLERFDSAFQPFHPSFKVLFNSYYNGVGEKHPRAERGLISRPDLSAVQAFRRHVTERVAELISRLAGKNHAFVELTWLGINHEEQHQELILTDLKHLFSKNPLSPTYQPGKPLATPGIHSQHWIGYEGGQVEIGHSGKGFGFDNEGPRHTALLQPFELSAYPVTQGEFATFIANDGYRRPEWWLSAGWDWVQTHHIQAPLYWHHEDGRWMIFTLQGMVEIVANAPACHLNYFEADAYARWSKARLPRETEWEYAAAALPVAGNFVESQALHPLPLQEERSSTQPAQMFGDIWEWTQSAYLPYPRFQPAAGAVGEYNGKFMCNQFVLRGGSCVTPQAHIRATYRNFFPPDARWQFSGLRLARDR